MTPKILTYYLKNLGKQTKKLQNENHDELKDYVKKMKWAKLN